MEKKPKNQLVACSEKHTVKFKSYSHAAAYFKVSDGTIKSRIKKAQQINGYTLILRPIEECEDIELAPQFSIRKLTNHHAECDVEMDTSLYIPIKYEVRYGHICITRCPFKYDDKPFVGSALCVACGSFRGRNRERQLVACNLSKK